jgi:beta propeller repeat protein
MIRINKFSFELIVCLFLMRRFTLFLLATLVTGLVLLAALPSSAGIGDGRHLVRNLSNNGASNWGPQISGSNVVWSGDADGNYEIYLHDGTSVTNLSNNGAVNHYPQISGSNVVWRGDADGNYEIYLHDGTSVTNLSNNGAVNHPPPDLRLERCLEGRCRRERLRCLPARRHEPDQPLEQRGF